jgi:hypothetical protein
VTVLPETDTTALAALLRAEPVDVDHTADSAIPEGEPQ